MKKIKLQDYALINIKELDKRINYYNKQLAIVGNNNERIIAAIDTITDIKQSLIPSEKLAEVAWKQGVSYLDYPLFSEETLKDFLSSTIQID